MAKKPGGDFYGDIPTSFPTPGVYMQMQGYHLFVPIFFGFAKGTIWTRKRNEMDLVSSFPSELGFGTSVFKSNPIIIVII